MESISFPLRILKTKRKKTESTADLPFSQKISAYSGIKIPETGSFPFPAFSLYSHISILSARRASTASNPSKHRDPAEVFQRSSYRSFGAAAFSTSQTASEASSQAGTFRP